MNKYRSEITTQPKTNNLDYMTDSKFMNIIKLFVFPFKRSHNEPTRDSFDQYHLPLEEIKHCNALIDKKPFFDQPVKTNIRGMKNLLKGQEIMTIQQEINYIFCTIKSISSVLI